MKKFCVLMAIVLLFTLAAGCGKKPDAATPAADAAKATGAANPTEATGAANPTEATGSADPTEATNTDGTQNAADPNAGQNEPTLLNAAEFEQLIRDNTWYWRALGCTFAAPEEISLEYYFYTGTGDKTQATDEELEFILDAFKKKNPNSDPNFGHNYIRMPAEKLNEGLAILGLTLKDVKIPDRWAYYEKLDNYYSWRSDAYGVELWSVTKAEKDDEGIVKVYWQTDRSLLNTSTKEFYPSGTKKMVMTMQLQEDGTYRVLSNLPEA